jgi:phospholipid/cholesterol/gamma-HCH transport system ATP-binding protein
LTAFLETPVIEVQNLWKSFGQQEVLRGVSLRVETGELMALVGMSGCGKSILLKHLVGLMQPDRGRVWLGGLELAGLGRAQLEALRGRIGYVFQTGALFDSMSVIENVAFPLREKTSLTETEIQAKTMKALEQVGLERAGGKYPAQLSGGMVRRAALARALVRDPEIVLFDEPTTGLDPIVANSILSLIAAVRQRLKFTGVIVSHDIPEIFGIVQKVAMLHEGRVIGVENAGEVLRSRNPVIEQFVNGRAEGPLTAPLA